MLLQVFKSFNPAILFAPLSFRSERFLHVPAGKIVEYEPDQSLGLKSGFLAAIKDEEARRNACYILLGHGENLLEIMNHRFFKADIGKVLPQECLIAKDELANLLRTPEWLHATPSEQVVLELLQHVEKMAKLVQQATYSANKLTARAIEAKKVPREIIFKLYGLPQLDHVVDRFEAFYIHEKVYQAVADSVRKSITGAAVKELLVRGPLGWAELWVETSVRVVEEFETKGAFGRGSVFKESPGYPRTHDKARAVAIATLPALHRRRLDTIASMESAKDRYRARISLTPESLLDGLWRELLNVWGPGGTESSREDGGTASGPSSRKRPERSSSDPQPRRASMLDRGRQFVRRMSGNGSDTMQTVSTYSSGNSTAVPPTILAPDVSMTARFSTTATATETLDMDYTRRYPVKWTEHADPAARARAYHAWRSRATGHIGPANVPVGYLPTTAELTLAGYSPAAVDALWSTGELPTDEQGPAKWELAYEISKDLRPRKDKEYHVHRTTGRGLVIVPRNRALDNFDVDNRLEKATAKLWVVKRRQDRSGVRFEGDYVSSSEDDRPPSPGHWERRGKSEAIDALNRLRARLDSRRNGQRSTPPLRQIPGPLRSPFVGITPPPPTRANSVSAMQVTDVGSGGRAREPATAVQDTAPAGPSRETTTVGKKQTPPSSPQRSRWFSDNAEAGPSRPKHGKSRNSSTDIATGSAPRPRTTKPTAPHSSSKTDNKATPKGKEKAEPQTRPELRRSVPYSPPAEPPKVRISQAPATTRGLDVLALPSGTAVEAVRRRTGDLFMGSGLPQGEEQAGTWHVLNNPPPSWRDMATTSPHRERVSKNRSRSRRMPTKADVDEMDSMLKHLDDMAKLRYKALRGELVPLPTARNRSPPDARDVVTPRSSPPEVPAPTGTETDDEFFECESFGHH
ncbi:uncharacterized protein LOC62_04G006533 [Vanrija pseudolonga]|uniref:Uncharacterized protein n=1 Tax=Vanrija pseudolonga TaxID=143232 RepID=A0AAF1BS69_9TREE|nr:hypothetical protein LOC62_04G006533 [Vanrija pseudolonga]